MSDTEWLVENVRLTVMNTSTIWDIVDWCADAMVKKLLKGVEPRLDVLRGSSTVSSIITAAKKELARCGSPVYPTRQQMPLLKAAVADVIWDCYEEKLDRSNEPKIIEFRQNV